MKWTTQLNLVSFMLSTPSPLLLPRQVVERMQEIKIQEEEMARKEKELNAKVRQPAEAEKYRMEKLAEANKNQVILEGENSQRSYFLSRMKKRNVGRKNEQIKMTEGNDKAS